MTLVLNKGLDDLKKSALKKIDQRAEIIRGYFITEGSGQSMVYRQKEIEATNFIADQNITSAEIPHITAEAALFNVSVFEQAVLVLTMAEQWKSISAIIENIRLAAKENVKSAADYKELSAALDVNWSSVLMYVPQ